MGGVAFFLQTARSASARCLVGRFLRVGVERMRGGGGFFPPAGTPAGSHEGSAAYFLGGGSANLNEILSLLAKFGTREEELDSRAVFSIRATW